MYNRYIRNDHGTYTRIPEEDGLPVPPSGGEPVHGGEPVLDGTAHREREPSHEGASSSGETPPRSGNGGTDAPPHGPPPRNQPSDNQPPHSPPPRRHGGGSHGGRGHGGPGGLFRRFLDDARMDRIDDGDLLLLGLLLFLAREGADEELLTALGLLLIL